MGKRAGKERRERICLSVPAPSHFRTRQHGCQAMKRECICVLLFTIIVYTEKISCCVYVTREFKTHM